MSKQISLEVNTDELEFILNDKFENDGNIIELKAKLPYSSLQTVRNIGHCNECPVGYMCHNCGRRIPLDYNCVPESCKLKRIPISDLLRLIADYIDIANMIE